MLENPPKSRTSSTVLGDADDSLTAAARSYMATRKIGKGNIGLVYDAAVDLQKLPLDEASSVMEEVQQEFSTLSAELQIGSLVHASEALTKALDFLGEIHPFIKIAVIPFKVAFELEKKRKENDQKVLALFVKMLKMMESLRMLPIKAEELESASGKAIAARMTIRLHRAADTIKECCQTTQDYCKSKSISRMVKSKQWEHKFTGFAIRFAEMHGEFEADLLVFTNAGVQDINRTVKQMDMKISLLIRQIFASFTSPEEHKILEFIEQKGGPDKFIGGTKESDQLVREIMDKYQQQSARSGQSGDRTIRAEPMGFQEMKKELGRDLESILAESKQSFDQTFQEQANQIAELRNDVRRGSDRVIQAFRAGAHDRILDKVLHEIWREMGWKGSAKTHHLALALHDFYVDQLHHMSFPTSIDDDLSESESQDIAKAVSHKLLNASAAIITPSDIWAIKLLSAFQLKPLFEAVDHDCSGFVSINNINEFTKSRPADWSLPQWTAYWTVGFEVTVRQYCYRIRTLLSHLDDLYPELIPGNAGVFSRIIRWWAAEDVVAGVCMTEQHYMKYLYQHPSFQEYASGVENRLEKRLKAVDYLIDDDIRLSLVTGAGRLEEYLMPLVYLLVRNILRIAKKGKMRILKIQEFEPTLFSLLTLCGATGDRMSDLRDVFELRNKSAEDELRKYCFGMFYYVFNPNALDQGPYYNQPLSYYNMPDSIRKTYDDNDDDDDEDTATTSHPILNGDINALDYGGYEETKPPSDSENISESPILVGTWSGYFFYHDFDSYYDLIPEILLDGHTSFHIDSIDTQGSFSGEGNDTLGSFNIRGTLKDQSFEFSKRYIRSQTEWAYWGEVNEALDAIEGEWGEPKDQVSPDMSAAVNDADEQLGTQDESIPAINGQPPPADETLPTNEGNTSPTIDGESIPAINVPFPPEDEILPTNEGNAASTIDEESIPAINMSSSPKDESLPTNEGNTPTIGEECIPSISVPSPPEDATLPTNEGNTASTIDEESIPAINVPFPPKDEPPPTNEGNSVSNGTFMFQKKSSEYVRFYPSKEKLAANRYRFLWKFAIDMIKYQLSTHIIFWSVLKRRRDERRRFIQLVKRNEEEVLNDSDVEVLVGLRKTLSIADIRLYLTLTTLEQGLEVVGSAYCDACRAFPLTPRFLCLECSHGRCFSSVDMCSSCIDKSFPVPDKNGTVRVTHLTTHPILQIRRPVSYRMQYAVRDNAIKTLRAANVREVQCALGECGKNVKQPYWACCQCPDVYICKSCNEKQSREWLCEWLYERTLIPAADVKGQSTLQEEVPVEGQAPLDTTDPDSEPIPFSPTEDDATANSKSRCSKTNATMHRWSHDLVLCAPLEPEARSVTVEERMEIMEKKLGELGIALHGMEARFTEALKRLLEVGR